MLERKAPTLHLFEQQLDAGKTLFGELAKKIRSKKAILLEEKLFFYQLFLELIGKIHFEEKKLSLKLFSPFDQLYRNLKLVHHVRLITDAYEESSIDFNGAFTEYKQDLDEDKKRIYTELFDTVLSAPIKIWEDLYLSVYPFIRQLTPFQVNTASTQLINEEVDFSHFDAKNELDPISIKDIYESLNKIIAIENIRTSMGLNPVFTDDVHKKINLLSHQLYDWYQNHLFFQHFSHFLREKETVDKRYLHLLKTIKKNHKGLTAGVVTQSVYLFTKVLH
jgi:hypothetical protein